MTNTLRAAGLLMLAAQLGIAADSDWKNVQGLRKGDRVGVIQANQKRVEGRFESATDARITLMADQTVTIEKADVVRVYHPPKHSRVFGAIVGGAIGVAGGAVADATLGQRFRNESNGPAPGLITGLSGGFGAAVGAAANGNYRTVYRVK